MWIWSRIAESNSRTYIQFFIITQSGYKQNMFLFYGLRVIPIPLTVIFTANEWAAILILYTCTYLVMHIHPEKREHS